MQASLVGTSKQMSGVDYSYFYKNNVSYYLRIDGMVVGTVFLVMAVGMGHLGCVLEIDLVVPNDECEWGDKRMRNRGPLYFWPQQLHEQ